MGQQSTSILNVSIPIHAVLSPSSDHSIAISVRLSKVSQFVHNLKKLVRTRTPVVGEDHDEITYPVVLLSPGIWSLNGTAHSKPKKAQLCCAFLLSYLTLGLPRYPSLLNSSGEQSQSEYVECYRAMISEQMQNNDPLSACQGLVENEERFGGFCHAWETRISYHGLWFFHSHGMYSDSILVGKGDIRSTNGLEVLQTRAESTGYHTGPAVGEWCVSFRSQKFHYIAYIMRLIQTHSGSQNHMRTNVKPIWQQSEKELRLRTMNLARWIFSATMAPALIVVRPPVTIGTICTRGPPKNLTMLGPFFVVCPVGPSDWWYR